MLLELTLQLRQMNKGLSNGGTVFRGEVRLQRAENMGVLQIRALPRHPPPSKPLHTIHGQGILQAEGTTQANEDRM